MRETGGPCSACRLGSFNRAKAIVRLDQYCYWVHVDRKLTSRIRRSHSCKQDEKINKLLGTYKQQSLPSNHLHERQLISHGYKLIPSAINKPIVSSEIPVFVAEMCAIKRVVKIESLNWYQKTYYIHTLTVATYLAPSWLISVQSSLRLCKSQNIKRISFTVLIIGRLRAGGEIGSDIECNRDLRTFFA